MDEKNHRPHFDDSFLDDLLNEDVYVPSSFIDASDVLSEEENETTETESTVHEEDVVEVDPETTVNYAAKLKETWKKVREYLVLADFKSMFLLRLITAYFVVSGWMILKMDHNKIDPISNWRDFVQGTSLGHIVLVVLSLMMLLMAVNTFIPRRYRVIEPLLAIGAILYFDMVTLWQVNNLYLTIGVMIVSLILMGYALSKLRTHRWFDKLPWWVYGIAGVSLAVVSAVMIAVATIHRHYVFGSGAHDFGLFVQMYHSLADNLTAITSCERDKLMSHFHIHASYIFYLLVPFFKMFPREETLLIAQAILAMGGVVPLILIAKRRGCQGLSLLFTAMAYAFCLALISPCFYEFHENAFLPTLLMWLLWTVESKKIVPFYVFSALVCIVKEDATLFVICIGLYWLFEHKGERKRWHGLTAAALSGVYMMLITGYLVKYGDGQMMTSSRFGHLLLDPEGGFAQVVANSLADPAYLMSLLVKESTLVFFLQVMLPLLFLPFCSKKIHRYWLMIPFVITNLVIGANYPHAAQVEYQYIFGPVTLLLYMAVVNVNDFAPRMRRNIPVLLGAAALIFSTGTVSHRIDYVDQYNSRKLLYVQLEQALDSIPADSVIGADAFYIPHISDRKEVYIFDRGDITDDKTALREPDRYDYIALPMNSDVYKEAAPLLEDAGFTVWAEVEHRMVILQKTQ